MNFTHKQIILTQFCLAVASATIGQPTGKFGGGDGSGYAGTATFQFDDVPLYVEWAAFEATPQNGSVLLEWETSLEVDNDYFSIERSGDGISYRSIGLVKGKGHTNQPTKYSFTDSNPLFPYAYYRLRQVDFDGQFDYSNVAYAGQLEIPELKVYPNPVQSGSSIWIETMLAPASSISVFNNSGQLVFLHQATKEVQNRHQLMLPSVLGTGHYIITVETIQGSFRHRIVVN